MNDPLNDAIGAALTQVRARIAQACRQAGRPQEAVTLLAVSKTQSAAAVRAAHAAGQTAFGENYIQEAVTKMAELADLPLVWHCIGPIQSNKTRVVAEHFDWVHSVDRIKTAQRLSDQRPASLAPLQVCVQVNIDGGANKSGCSPTEAIDLGVQIADLPRLTLRGVMVIPEPAPDFEAACAVFTSARAVFEQIKRQVPTVDTLSMGMSADLDAAIASGSTLVRVGTAVFGARTPAQG